MRTVTCPRCKEIFEWKYKNKPSLGWVCEYCREELNTRGTISPFHSRPMNDMEERKLDEALDFNSDSGDLPELEKEYQDAVLESIFAGLVTENDKKPQRNIGNGER